MEEDLIMSLSDDEPKESEVAMVAVNNGFDVVLSNGVDSIKTSFGNESDALNYIATKGVLLKQALDVLVKTVPTTVAISGRTATVADKGSEASLGGSVSSAPVYRPAPELKPVQNCPICGRPTLRTKMSKAGKPYTMCDYKCVNPQNGTVFFKS